MNNLKYFKVSLLVTVLGAAAAYFLLDGLHALFLVAVLTALKVSLSFDNAVVNSTVLRDMDAKWRHHRYWIRYQCNVCSLTNYNAG